jgi:hypothetical protein
MTHDDRWGRGELVPKHQTTLGYRVTCLSESSFTSDFPEDSTIVYFQIFDRIHSDEEEIPQNSESGFQILSFAPCTISSYETRHESILGTKTNVSWLYFIHGQEINLYFLF